MLNIKQRSQLSPQRARSIKLRIPNQKLLPADFFRRSVSQSPPKHKLKASASNSPTKEQNNILQSNEQSCKRYWDSMREQIQQNSPNDSSKGNPRKMRLSAQGEKRHRRQSQIGSSKARFRQGISKGIAKENSKAGKAQIWQQGLFTFSGNTNNKLFQIHLPPLK